MYKRTRITVQIVLTLFSFFGFNEAVLAVRYRNIVHGNDFNDQLIEPLLYSAEMLLAELPHF